MPSPDSMPVAEDQELVNESEMELFEIISNCTMVDRLRVPDCIIEEISDMARGVVVECCFCLTAGHLDLQLFMKRDLNQYLTVIC